MIIGLNLSGPKYNVSTPLKTCDFKGLIPWVS
jgi:hypothetical protein